MAIGSSSQNTPLILERIGLKDFFDAVADGSMIEKSKPDPEVFLLAASLMDIPPKCCLVVEDAPAGVEAGVRGGFDVAAIGANAKSASAKYHINHFRELPSLLLRS
jgi:beta-phosphoglucomutase